MGETKLPDKAHHRRSGDPADDPKISLCKTSPSHRDGKRPEDYRASNIERYLDHRRDRLDQLEADQTDYLHILIPVRTDLVTEDFPTCATGWNQLVGFERDEHLNFFTIPVAEPIKAKLAGVR